MSSDFAGRRRRSGARAGHILSDARPCRPACAAGAPALRKRRACCGHACPEL